MRTVPLTEEAKHRMLELMQDDECRVIWDSSLLLHSSKNATNYAYQQILDTLKAEGHEVLSCKEICEVIEIRLVCKFVFSSVFVVFTLVFQNPIYPYAGIIESPTKCRIGDMEI